MPYIRQKEILSGISGRGNHIRFSKQQKKARRKFLISTSNLCSDFRCATLVQGSGSGNRQELALDQKDRTKQPGCCGECANRICRNRPTSCQVRTETRCERRNGRSKGPTGKQPMDCLALSELLASHRQAYLASGASSDGEDLPGIVHTISVYWSSCGSLKEFSYDPGINDRLFLLFSRPFRGCCDP